MISRHLRATAGLVLGAVLASGAFVVTVPMASATPLGDAQQRAAQLRVKVDTLRQQAEIATEEYDAAYAELGAAVSAHLSAQRDLQQAKDASATTDDRLTRRVRALYMSGGAPALYAKVLESATLSEVAQRVNQVSAVLDGDHRATTDAGAAVARRRDAEHRLADAAAASTRLQSAVADRGDKVRELLARTDALLAAADQQVRAIADAQRKAAEQAAAARAALELARAQSLGSDLPAVEASPLASAVLAFAAAQIGKPYVWGATGPASFDCSGLTGAAYGAAGLALPRTSRQQWFAGPHVSMADLEPGDLLFWASNPADPGSIHHVALYAGNGLMVAAPHAGDVVKLQKVYLDGYIGAVRPGASLAPAAP